MDDRARIYTAVASTVGLFVVIQLGALLLVEPFVAADAQPVENPGDPRNSMLFFAAILAATGVMLAALRWGGERMIRGAIILACGFLGWFVGDVAMQSLLVLYGVEPLDTMLWVLSLVVPLLVAGGIVGGLLYHPEWYVIDAAGIVMGAGAAALFGISFGPFPAILFLVVLAVYDAISVYGTKHMLTLAEGVMDMKVPVVLVVPTTLSYSFLDDDPTATKDNTPTEKRAEAPSESDETVRDAIYIGLGDAVMPTILVASSAVFLSDAVPPLDVPGIALNLPALTTMIGTTVGLVILLWLVLKGRAHAGLPLLNGGAIVGYLVGATASGLSLVEAIGLPL